MAIIGTTPLNGLVGSYRPHVSRQQTGELARLRAAFAPGEGPVGAYGGDSLALVAGGPHRDPIDRYDGFLCVLEGSLYEVAALARAVELPTEAGVPRLLIAAYRRFGASMLDRLRGDFVLLVWDEAAGEGLIARDQLGGRSLFLNARGEELLFASEVRHLLRVLPSRPAPDPVALVHWLAQGGPPHDHTFYEGVRQLPAGHCVVLQRTNWRVVRYWCPRYGRPQTIEMGDAAASVRNALEQAVARRSVDGARTGVLLSGGIDSAAVAGLAVCSGHPPNGAYSAVFPRHPTIDESRLIKAVAEELGLAGFALPVTGGSVVAGAAEYTRIWHVPAVSPNFFFWELLMRRAADDGVTAMLDGEGGDALFWLSPYLLADRLVHGRIISAIRLARRFPGAEGPVPPSMVATLLRTWGVRGALPYTLLRARQRVRGQRAFAPRWFSDASVRLRFETDVDLEWKRFSGAPRWWSALLDSLTGVGSTLMHDAARRRGGPAGVEARHPLLDVDLIELVLSLPPELAFDPRLSRPLLRESVTGLIPEAVRLRPTKSRFDALFHEILSGRELPIARSLLLEPNAEVNAFVDPECVRMQLFEKGPPLTPGALQTWALDVWRLLTAEIWLRAEAGTPLEL